MTEAQPAAPFQPSAQLWDEALRRYQADPLFHARAEMAVHAVPRLNLVDPLLMAAILGVHLADLDPATGRPVLTPEVSAVRHVVTLPQPYRREPGRFVTGSCSCGDWSLAYGWGGHDEATRRAGEHVRTVARAQPIDASDLSGERTVQQGPSL